MKRLPQLIQVLGGLCFALLVLSAIGFIWWLVNSLPGVTNAGLLLRRDRRRGGGGGHRGGHVRPAAVPASTSNRASLMSCQDHLSDRSRRHDS